MNDQSSFQAWKHHQILTFLDQICLKWMKSQKMLLFFLVQVHVVVHWFWYFEQTPIVVIKGRQKHML